MVIWITLWISVPLFFRKNRSEKLKSYFCRLVAVLLPGQYIFMMVMELINGNFSIQKSLPLNLCDFSCFLCAVLLITKSRKLFEVLYFWVLGGTIQSFVTPNISYAFPHIEFTAFYIQHGGMILVIIYLIFVESMLPQFISVLKSIISLFLFLGIVYLFNILTGSNYNFLMADTPNPSTVTEMIALFGEPPRHLIGLGLVIFITYVVLYTPFFISDLIRGKKPLK